MRREGRQHGYVRTHVVPLETCADASEDHQTRMTKNKPSSMPVAGVFTKVSRKPTNHSKFTGKCNKQMCVSCREAPASKSKNKSKGTRKFRAFTDDEGLHQAIADVKYSISMDDERHYELSDALLDDIAFGRF
ncbi:hypothetical protein FCM35_KLT07379 [Carex littledalei]|uniref:Uncharacterized protein n=1 Tax=Carex littledalei TaxID=544730 RepID=A0A833QZC8_9POAL|nr:hypothetical protein FCM35_KLT07379 [Carex littledalei]